MIDFVGSVSPGCKVFYIFLLRLRREEGPFFSIIKNNLILDHLLIPILSNFISYGLK